MITESACVFNPSNEYLNGPQNKKKIKNKKNSVDY